jgi:hypothetical protein
MPPGRASIAAAGDRPKSPAAEIDLELARVQPQGCGLT